MPAVSNTSPLLNLAAVGFLPFVRDQFREIYIPHAVHDELRVKEDLPGNQSIRADGDWGRSSIIQKLIHQLNN